MPTAITDSLQRLRAASRRLARCPDADIQAILHRIADLTLARQDELLAQNALDLARMDPADPRYDRLLLDEKRLAAIAADLRQVAALPSPVGRILETRTRPNGLQLQKIAVPIGVLATPSSAERASKISGAPKNTTS